MKKIIKLFIAIIIVFTIQTSLAYTSNQLDVNKKNVVDFYNAAFNELNFDAASKYLGKRYIQHYPAVADDREGLKDYIQLLRNKFPKTHVEIKRVFVDGDYVILQVHFIKQPMTQGSNVIDIFRLVNGKIVEHWGASQDIPEKSANSNGIF